MSFSLSKTTAWRVGGPSDLRKFIFLAVGIASAAVLTGCGDVGDTPSGSGSPVIPPAQTGVQLYTYNASSATFSPYNGTGQARTVTLSLFGTTSESSVAYGTVGNITASGKLSLTWPDISEDKMFDFPELNAPVGTKIAAVSLSPNLRMRSPAVGSNGSTTLTPIYANRAFSVSSGSNSMSLQKGLNFQSNDGTSTLITDTSACKWVID